MTVTATEFKAKCLALIDRVQATGEVITITKRGRRVAALAPAPVEDDRPWLALRKVKLTWHGDPFAPAVSPEDIDAERE